MYRLHNMTDEDMIFKTLREVRSHIQRSYVFPVHLHGGNGYWFYNSDEVFRE